MNVIKIYRLFETNFSYTYARYSPPPAYITLQRFHYLMKICALLTVLVFNFYYDNKYSVV